MLKNTISRKFEAKRVDQRVNHFGVFLAHLGHTFARGQRDLGYCRSIDDNRKVETGVTQLLAQKTQQRRLVLVDALHLFVAAHRHIDVRAFGEFHPAIQDGGLQELLLGNGLNELLPRAPKRPAHCLPIG